MLEGVEPVTRLSVADEAPGWLKLTVPPLPTENDCQLTMAWFDDWLMLSVPARGELMLALPAATEPPVGSVCANAAPLPPVSAAQVMTPNPSRIFSRNELSRPTDVLERAGTV
jgi:hypothetical protein